MSNKMFVVPYTAPSPHRWWSRFRRKALLQRVALMNERQRTDAARNDATSRAMLTLLVSDSSPLVRAAIIARRDTPFAWRMAIGRVAPVQVARAWARSPVLTTGEMDILVSRYGDDSVVGALLASRADLPHGLLMALASAAVDGRVIERLASAMSSPSREDACACPVIRVLLRRWPSIPHSRHTYYALRRLLDVAYARLERFEIVELIQPVMKRSPRASFEACSSWPAPLLALIPSAVFFGWLASQSEETAGALMKSLARRAGR